jgi:hypothetical protein
MFHMGNHGWSYHTRRCDSGFNSRFNVHGRAHQSACVGEPRVALATVAPAVWTLERRLCALPPV